MIAAAGPPSVSEEMTLPGSAPAIRKWLNDSYTPAKHLGAWQEVFQVYAATFPNECISLAGPRLPILDQGRFDRSMRLRAKREIVDRALRAFGQRLAIQSNDVGQHINCLEIYEGDVIPADMQPVLQYAASLFHR
jgi:hypothetical protein